MYSTTPEGILFVQHAAADWAAAARADGEDPDAAHEAAKDTVVIYTTLPEEDATTS